jgi:hypothetical protein
MGAKQKCIHKIKIDQEIKSRYDPGDSYMIKSLFCNVRKTPIVSENKAYHITTCTGCKLRACLPVRQEPK